jgi:hypothetical protein
MTSGVTEQCSVGLPFCFGDIDFLNTEPYHLLFPTMNNPAGEYHEDFPTLSMLHSAIYVLPNTDQ